jgi:hypothetical protein
MRREVVMVQRELTPEESAEVDRLVDRAQRSLKRQVQRTEREWDEIEEFGS